MTARACLPEPPCDWRISGATPSRAFQSLPKEVLNYW